MSQVRPEVQALLRRWREALVGLGLALLGALIGLTALGWITAGFGWIVAALGLILAVIGLQRGRFRSGGGGPGVVEVTEGRLAYFGPLSGGVADLDEVIAIGLERAARPYHWRIAHRGGPALHIPLTASGADQLFDAFAGLPGFDTEAMLREMHRDGPDLSTIWQRPSLSTAPRRLH